MPPKQQVSKKTEQKQKERVIEDKTFGLKNKKGAKQQKYIQQVQNQVKQQSAQKVRNDEVEKKKEKDRKQKEMEELNALFKCVEQAVPKGVDPKSIVCENFKKAKCAKGDKCKFSHDLNQSRKAQKINIYEDKRDLEEAARAPGFTPKGSQPRSQKMCPHFLEAVENKKYGWFWVCPNGGNNCQYRHALPEGYVLKSEKKEEKEEEQISLEDLIEKERAMITDTTKITLETFLIWKKKKLKEKAEQKLAATAKKQADFNKDKVSGLSGREMFTFKNNSSAAFSNEEESGDDQVMDYKREDEDEALASSFREINLDEFSMQIIRENEEELAKQKAKCDSQSASSETTAVKYSIPTGVHEQQPSASQTNEYIQPCSSSTNVNSNHEDQPGPSSRSLINAGGLEIDEELFSQEINELSDLELSDEEQQLSDEEQHEKGDYDDVRTAGEGDS